jgi:hypothetical protein
MQGEDSEDVSGLVAEAISWEFLCATIPTVVGTRAFNWERVSDQCKPRFMGCSTGRMRLRIGKYEEICTQPKVQCAQIGK